MKKLLKMLGLFNRNKSASQNNSVRPVELGYALAFSNDEIGLDIFGSPKEIVEEIKQRGLDVNEVAQLPSTIIDAQKVRQDTPVLQFKGGPFAEPMMQLLDSLSVKDIESAETILSNAPGIFNENNISASVPMIAYSALGDLDAVKFLIDHKSSPNLPGHMGMTPLHWAAGKGYVDVADLLITHAANPTALGWFLLTPAEVASINGHSDLAQKLKDYGSDYYEQEKWMGFLQRMGIRKG